MLRISDCFDEVFLAQAQGVYRLCFLLARRKEAARRLTFEAFLRLGAAKADSVSDPDKARALLYRAAVRQCDDYYLSKPHRKPARAQLERMELPFALTQALWETLQLPFSRRAAIGLLAAGFSQEEARALLARARRLPVRAFSPEDSQLEAVSRVCMTQEDCLAVSDEVYARFAERSVGVENALHAVKSAFDRLAPVLLLIALALCVAAWRLTG